jgi:hypothetical protein
MTNKEKNRAHCRAYYQANKADCEVKKDKVWIRRPGIYSKQELLGWIAAMN